MGIITWCFYCILFTNKGFLVNISKKQVWKRNLLIVNKNFVYFSKLNQIFSLFAFFLIIISVIFFDESLIPPFPNVYTWIPTCGAAFIILCGNKNTLIGYLLSTHLLRWIGLISYSDYLWHQPSSFIFKWTITIWNNNLVILLSILSHLFVEESFRNRRRFSQKTIFLIGGLLT